MKKNKKQVASPHPSSPTSISWTDYRDIAAVLEKKHSNEDVMMLRREKLIALIQDIPNFDAKGLKPDPYALDDIRFEWFFLKKGTDEWPDFCYIENVAKQ